MQPPDRPFALDRFQVDAVAALDAGRSVLVAAPTGSGKTVVAEHAVDLALATGRRAFYTAPIKALSNQKYHDFVARLGAEQVGLLTGDNSINGDAPVVVMTTEVLRNMIYAGSDLSSLGVVVLDEVHFLQDAYRGPVWEEVIIHLPGHVRLVCLSATVSNTTELTEWITTVRGPTDTVLETTRPVELVPLYFVGDHTAPTDQVVPILLDGRPNPVGERFDRDPRPLRVRGRVRSRFYTPTRIDVVDRLYDQDLLPAIYFIFSRAACSDAVRNLLEAGIHLTTPDERTRIRELVEEHTSALSDEDLAILGFDRFVAGLEAGIAAHHAGMVPPFKEAVEACFVEGLVKVVFATETLALGINMPARSVVIERLTKFGGEHHEFLTPAQFTQLTGRAGRRGIDRIGHAVVLWSPFVPFQQVADLAASRSFRLTSSFRPTYNMAANLVRRYPPEQARHLLNLSFAQFQADGSIVRLEALVDKRRAALAEAQDAARCERGDVGQLVALRKGLDDARRRPPADHRSVDDAVARLKPGDVLWLEGGKSPGPAAVLSVSSRKGGAHRVALLTLQRRLLRLDQSHFALPPEPIGTFELPTPYAPNSRSFQQETLRRLRRVKTRPARRQSVLPSLSSSEARALENEVLDHPVSACPDAGLHLRAHARAERLARELERASRDVHASAGSLARQFDRVLDLLRDWGCVEPDHWALTDRGRLLAGLYHECDLLIATALADGLLDGLDHAALAGLVSCFTYEHRSPVPPPPPWFPSSKVRERFDSIRGVATRLRAAEDQARLNLTREPDATFVALAHAWAAGEDLAVVLEDEDLSGGDFVRTVKQLIDLLRQIGDLAPDPDTARAARQAADGLFRGVIAASSVVSATVPFSGEGV